MSFRFNQGDRPLPGYTIERGVGRGGFGEVYYALSDGGKEVALKYLRENPQVELRGVTHCLNLKSPHLVANHDIRQNEAGDFFVIMEYVNGPTLRDLMNEEPSGLGPQKAAYFLREIAKGLAYLHDRGIVHRDLKPGNIFYEDGYVKIGDYGLSKIMAASQHSGQTMSVGTVHYMAPEVGSGNYDRTIDIYALGVMLYEMLLGRVPFSGASMGEVLMKHLTAQPEVDELPQPFPTVIRKALAKDPKDRYQSVNEMMADVFAVEEINRSVASMDSLNLSRMAAAVATKVKVGAAAGGGGHGGAAPAGFGSSNVPPLGANRPPPPIVERGRTTATRRGSNRRTARDLPLWEDFKRRPFGISNAEGFPQRTRTTTGLMAVCLGSFGLHRFYTGHNGLGVCQILATLCTGVGALWGIIEGIQILTHGDFRDAMGRPLLGKPPVDPDARHLFARVFWGLLGTGAILAAAGLAIAATVVTPEYEWFHDGVVTYSVNVFHWMYVGASAVFALGAFAMWKASHRGGLPFWRASVRPALMSFFAAIIGAGLAIELTIAPYRFQGAALVVVGAAASAFLILWLLRGNGVPVRRGDVYWNRAWMVIFLLIGIVSGACATSAGTRWAEDGYELTSNRQPTRTIEGKRHYFARPLFGADGAEIVTHTISQPVYNHDPVMAGLLGILAIGSLGEARYRRRRGLAAAGILSDRARTDQA